MSMPATETEANKVRLVNWVAADAGRGMPSFIGLSMREALVQAARAGWDVQTNGSGYVLAQDPAPGAERASSRKLHLQFGAAAG